MFVYDVYEDQLLCLHGNDGEFVYDVYEDQLQCLHGGGGVFVKIYCSVYIVGMKLLWSSKLSFLVTGH